MKNNVHDKVFVCPKCFNKTLTPVDPATMDNVFGVGYGDILICNECGAELQAVPNYDGTVDFKEIEEEE